MSLIDEAKHGGASEGFICWLLEISPRTIQRWREPVVPAVEPVPVARPHNALSCPEAAAVVSIIRSPAHADESCRELALSLSGGNAPVFTSHVTVWHYQTLLGCNGPRGRQRERIAGGAHDFDWVSGPNQLWTYDVSYLLTGRRLEYFFLYGLLDFYSRKVVSWLVSDRFVSDEIQRLWDQGLINEGMLNKPKSEWPQAHRCVPCRPKLTSKNSASSRP